MWPTYQNNEVVKMMMLQGPTKRLAVFDFLSSIIRTNSGGKVQKYPSNEHSQSATTIVRIKK